MHRRLIVSMALLAGCLWNVPALEGADATKKEPLPLIKVASDLFDQTDGQTLGLPSIPGEHTVLYHATEDSYKFCHQQNIGIFKDRLYVMWSNGILPEDHNGQRVLYSTTSDGVDWSEPAVLAPDPDGLEGRMACVSAGFHVAGDTLVAYYTAIVDGHPIHKDNSLYYQTSKDGEKWSSPKRLAEGFFIESPRRLPSGRLLFCGQWVHKQPRLMFSDSPDGITGWRDAVVPELKDGSFVYPEPSWFLRRDGTIVMLFRTRSKHADAWVYASTSSDNGITWTKPARTNFPDASARICAGNLPDGTAYVINNPSHVPGSIYNFVGRRNPLTIATSRDGIVFDRAYVIHRRDTQPRFPGKNKLPGWQYPAAIVWKDHLYVVYSINKEDEGVTRIALSDLNPDTVADNKKTTDDVPTVRVASLSILPQKWDKPVNADKIERMVSEAASRGAQLVITPEGVLEGYVVNEVIHEKDKTRKALLTRRFRRLAEPIDGPYIQRFRQLADRLNVHLILGFLEADGEALYNTAALLGPEGELVGKYRKTHFAQGYDVNPPGYTPGDRYPVFQAGKVKVGMMICFDRALPEPARMLSVAGADLIACPAYGGWNELNRWRMRVRANENDVHVIFTHPHQSLIIARGGDLVARQDGTDTMVLRDLPIGPPTGGRGRLTLRRPETFDQLSTSLPDK